MPEMFMKSPDQGVQKAAPLVPTTGEIPPTSPPLMIGRGATRIIEPDQAAKDRAKKVHDNEVKKRTDGVTTYNTKLFPWTAKIEPEAQSYLQATSNIDQSLLISIAISLVRLVDATLTKPKALELMPEQLPNLPESQPATGDADVRYSSPGNGYSRTDPNSVVERQMAGVSAYPTGQGPNGERSPEIIRGFGDKPF